MTTLLNLDSAALPTDGQVLAYDAASKKWLPVTPSGGGGGSTLTATDAPTAPAEGTSASYLVSSAVTWPAGLVWSTDPDGGEEPVIDDYALVSLFTLGGVTRAVMGATFPVAATTTTTTTAGTTTTTTTTSGSEVTLTYRSTETGLSAADVAIGTASAARSVIVVLTSRDTGGGNLNVPTACTIGGVSATRDNFYNAASPNDQAFAVFRAVVPTGTTATITCSGGNIGEPSTRLHVWTADAALSVVSAPAVSAQASTNSITLSTTAVGGFIVAGVCGDFAAGTANWTNATERHDSLFHSSADSPTDGTAKTVTCASYIARMMAVAYGAA